MAKLNAQTRAELGGDYCQIPGGVVHYELGGPRDGPPVVLVAGMATPLFIWDPTFAALAEAGYRVLRYDHLGRGYSDRPRTTYDLDLFVGQLRDLLPAVGIETPVHLAGMSMGAAVCVAFADRYPDQAGKLVLIAPAGFPAPVPPGLRLLRAPLLGDALMALTGRQLVYATVQGLFFDTELEEDYIENFERQMQFAGVVRAVHSTLRHFPRDLSETYRRVGRQGWPVLLVWGEEDDTAPFATHEAVRAALQPGGPGEGEGDPGRGRAPVGGVEFLAVPRACHAVHYEKAEVVSPAIIDFLGR